VYIVHFKDLRYDYPGRTGRSPLGAAVELDRNLKVVSATFGFRSRRAPSRRTGQGKTR